MKSISKGRLGAEPGASAESLLGYDLIRIAAMALVALQHVLSVSGIEPRPILGRLNVGQLGVTIFCALSGFFALQPGGEPAHRWLLRRLVRIYMPYWITLATIFIANGIVGYKPMTPGLVAAQFLGIAFFTHKDNIVGVYTWFISLILVCYAIAAVARAFRWTLPIALGAAAALTIVAPDFNRHVLSFLTGAIMASVRKSMLASACMPLAYGGAVWLMGDPFAYPLAGAVALLIGGALVGRSPGKLASISRATYEFFLVHGPIYLFLAKMLRFSCPVNAVIGTALSVAAAWCLRRATALLRALSIRPRPESLGALASERS
jgi:hypothetical protein